MNLTESILHFEEGFVRHAYSDHKGFLTIGYGFCVDKRRDCGIPRKVADFWFRELLTETRGTLAATFGWFEGMSEARQAVCVAMVYQMGFDGFCRFRNTIRYLAAENWEAAADEMRDSAWWRDEKTRGRAERMAHIIKTDDAGHYEAN